MTERVYDPRHGGLSILIADTCPAGWALTGVMALREPALALHSVRGTTTAFALAGAAGIPVDLPTAWGFLLHDLGSLEVPVGLLGRPGPLTEEDRSVVNVHPVRSAQLLGQVPELDGASRCALAHHERWDGAGYPAGLRGSDIPVAARVLAVADAFAALTAPRPHRLAQVPDTACEVILDEAGGQFDPELAGLMPSVVATLPPELVDGSEPAAVIDLLGPRLGEHVGRAADLGAAQLQALFAAALGLDAVEAAGRLGRAPGTQRTWAASLRRALACPPRLSLRHFLAGVGRQATQTCLHHLMKSGQHAVAGAP